MTRANQPTLPTLPMHLLLSMGCWLSSPFALECAKSGLLPLKVKSKKRAKLALNKKLERAVAQEAKHRAANLLSGVLRYHDTPYERKVTEPAVAWQSGNARLLDYGVLAPDPSQLGEVVLFIPSLINRYYILDLDQERSLLRYLVAQGIYPLVMDWGEPGPREEAFGCSEYVSEILVPAIDFVVSSTGRKVALAGYCMGGVLAIAAAKLKPKKISALALFATPWDFHCKEFAPFVIDPQYLGMLDSALSSQGRLSADFVQSLFYVTDPWIFEQKFSRYAQLQPDSRAARDFVALEHWVNDGVPMTAQVARDCLVGWAQKNMLRNGGWKIGKVAITPEGLDIPVFMALPQNDHVVPVGCAQPLVNAFPEAKRIHPSAGHVGMMVGSRAKRDLWQPFVKWVEGISK